MRKSCGQILRCPASVIASIGGNDRVIAVSKEMLNEEDPGVFDTFSEGEGGVLPPPALREPGHEGVRGSLFVGAVKALRTGSP